VDISQSVVIIGLIIFGIFQTKNLKKLQTLKPATNQEVSINTSSPSESKPTEPNFSFFEKANDSLQASVSGLLNRLEQLEESDTKTTTSTKQSTTSYTPRSTTPAFQTQDIYFGSASTTNTSWTDTGLETSLYSNHYPSTVNLYFEAGLSIIGGEVWARLKNKTTGAVIGTSEVSHNNSTVTWKYSQSFKMHSGNNVYVVQLKSTSSETANLSGARLKISN